MATSSELSTGGGPGAPPAPAPHPVDHAQRYGRSDHLEFHREGHDEDITRIRDLFRRPLIRQWIDGGKLYREAEPREVPRFELFFDLLYVGIIHQLAEAAIEGAGARAVARFILTFYPSWSIWEEARRYSNVSGVDDLLHRLWVLGGMACMLGYSVSASAIELRPKRGADFNPLPVHCAAAFWLIIKFTRVVVLWYYAWRLPRFRMPQFLTGCATLVPMFVYLVILAALGIVVDLVRIDVLFFLLASKARAWRVHRRSLAEALAGQRDPQDIKPFDWHVTKMGDVSFPVPAVNIEHSLDRSGAFVVIVLGELVSNLLYTAGKNGAGFGASHTYGKAVMGLMIAWALNYLYMVPGEEMNNYEHPLRRSWLTGVLFSFLHWPMVAALTLASAAASELLNNEAAEPAVAWYWGCGLGFSILFMSGVDALHHNLDNWRFQKIPRGLRLGFNCAGALVLLLVPLAYDRLSTTDMFGIALGVTWAVLVVNVVGILPSQRALDARAWEQAADPREPFADEEEADAMVEEDDIPHSFMPRRSGDTLRSRRSHTHAPGHPHHPGESSAEGPVERHDREREQAEQA